MQKNNMTRAELETVVIDTVETCTDKILSGVTLDSNLFHDLGFDSLDLIAVVCELEDELEHVSKDSKEFLITDEASEGFQTVEDILDYLVTRVNLVD